MEELHQMKEGNYIPFDISRLSPEEQDVCLESLANSCKYIFLEAIPGLHPSIQEKYMKSGFIIDMQAVVRYAQWTSILDSKFYKGICKREQ